MGVDQTMAGQPDTWPEQLGKTASIVDYIVQVLPQFHLSKKMKSNAVRTCGPLAQWPLSLSTYNKV